MSESEPTICIPQSGQVIKHCKWHIEHYVKCDAYVEYDWLGSPDPGKHNIITCRQRKPINGVMRARAPKPFWKYWRDRRDRPPPKLLAIPRDLDLVDRSDCEVEPRIDAVFELVGQMADLKGVADVAPTKALHLLRPRFVAISDSRVRKLLCIKEEFPGTTKGKKYAARAIAVQRGIRSLGRENAVTLAELHSYANEYANEHVSDLLRRTGVTSPKPRVKLSKARVLDILLWSHAAIHDLKRDLTNAATEIPEP